MKKETLTGAVVAMRNQLQPHFNDNVDIMIFDYAFFTELESFAKKERDKAKTKVIDYADKPDDYEGTMLKTSKQILSVRLSNAPLSFDLDTFLAEAAKQFGIDKFKLKELAGKCKKEGTPRKTYTVEEL